MELVYDKNVVFHIKLERYSFEAKKEKKDQVEVAKQIKTAIKVYKGGALLRHYLKTSFGLSKGQYAHNLVF